MNLEITEPDDMTIFNDAIAAGGMTRVKVIEIEVTLSTKYKDAVKINRLCTLSRSILAISTSNHP